ncbi:MAG TPA: hypothetical protein VG826_03315 [Pirellulales bacterium]|nr:hypothetical protein [Pirellulales bacterium]
MDINDDDFRTDVGSTQEDGKRRDFMRVIHLPTRKQRMVVGASKEGPLLWERLVREILDELNADQ